MIKLGWAEKPGETGITKCLALQFWFLPGTNIYRVGSKFYGTGIVQIYSDFPNLKNQNLLEPEPDYSFYRYLNINYHNHYDKCKFPGQKFFKIYLNECLDLNCRVDYLDLI